MQVSVYGAGYVGLVTAICLAELGHQVCCVDVDAAKIAGLSQGQIPIQEQGLSVLLKNNFSRLRFTTNLSEAVDFAALQMIAVGTPALEDGSVDLRQVHTVIEQIAHHMRNDRVIVMKSTVPVGTTQALQERVNDWLAHRDSYTRAYLLSNPEFLKEGTAVKDFMHPDRILIGGEHEPAIDLLRELYAFFIEKKIPLVVMDTDSSEFSKYAANAFLATKISFMNEMSQLSELLNVDIESVKYAMGLDKRIGHQFMNPGCGFGGSCFPKDLQALLMQAKKVNQSIDLVKAAWQVNEGQKTILFKKIQTYFKNDLKNKTIAIWGLAFKPNTDDVRCAPSRALMEQLWKVGARVRAFDPLAMEAIQKIYPSAALTLCADPDETLEGADALVLVTEWEVFHRPNFSAIKQKLRHPVIFDGRNIYDPVALQSLGFDYFGIGRKNSVKKLVTV